MATKKNLVLRKTIEGVLYDLMVKTVTDQVYTNDDTKTLTTIIDEINAAVAAKAGSADLTALEERINNMIADAPEAYDTFKEISDYLSSHKSEYEALVKLASNKVDKEDGKGLSTNDFTDELATKLTELYTKLELDELLDDIRTRLSAVETATGNPTAVTAADVKYTMSDGTETTVKAALDELLYVPVAITSVTSATASIQEKGVVLTGVVINWAYNKDDIVSQSINGVNLTDLTQRSYTDDSEVSTDKTYTVKVSDGTTEVSKGYSISFKNKVYYGVSEVNAPTEANSAFILGLTGNKYASSKSAVGSFTVNAEAGQYIYYAQPATFTEPVFNIGGFDTTFELYATIDFTNASGYTESYNIYKSGQAGLGSTSATVK